MNPIEQIMSLIAPHHCLGCGQEGRLLCRDCSCRLEPAPPRCYRCGCQAHNYQTCRSCQPLSPLPQVWACAAYKGLAKNIVAKLKFARAGTAAEDIARVMANILPCSGGWMLTNVPTANARVRHRGYDQAQLIIRQLARHMGCPYASLLARCGSQRQLGQNRAARQKQLQGAFVAKDPKTIQNTNILLIDDVLTTGATLEAAAAVLLAAGASQVSAAVFAAA